MATTMIPDAGIPSPPSSSEPLRFVAIRANLMPDEILSGRQADVMRKRVVIGLAAVVVLLALAFGGSWWQTRSANDDLGDVQRQGNALQNQQHQFGPLVNAQSQAQVITSQLHLLMLGDLSWKDMLTTLRAKAPNGVTLTNLTGTVTAGAASAGVAATPATGGYQVLNQSGRNPVGTLTITGTAPDKNSVAAYADQLTTVKGIASPFISSVTTADHNVSFTVTAIVTSDALSGRYAAPASTKPGGN
jgi:Tfp pilus assembly protein PilN